MKPPKQTRINFGRKLKPIKDIPKTNEITASELQVGFKLKGIKAKPKQEDDVQLELCQWLQKTYPNALFCSDIAGRNLSRIDRKVYSMRSHDKYGETVKFPDLIIYDHAGGYIGLALELKNENVQLTKKDGTLRANDHVKRQYQCLQRFASLGWAASFAVGLQAAKDLIIAYFDGQKIDEFY